MKLDQFTVILVLVTVKRLLAVTAEKNVSRANDDKDNNSVLRSVETGLKSDDKVTVNMNVQRKSAVNAMTFDTVASVREEEEFTLPTVSKEGILYYDITQAKEAQVVIPEKSRGVEGVTASREHGPCLVHTLVLEKGYVLDKDIAINCNLKNLTMRGRNWPCVKDWSWLKNLGEAVNYKEASCTDVFCPIFPNSTSILLMCSFEEGLKKVVQHDIPMCPEVCSRCNWYIQDDNIKASYICSYANLTESTFPDLPVNLTNLSLEGNKLRSTHKLFERLKKYRQIEVLYLGMNELDTFPNLDPDIFSNLRHVFLNDNQMKEFELGAIQKLLAKPECVISLDNNPWRCGCNAYWFSQIMLKYYRENEPIQHMNLLQCFDEANNEWIPLIFLSEDNCSTQNFTVNYWLLLNFALGLLNTIMVYLILDLSLIIANFRGWKNTKRPKMDCAVCWLKAKLKAIKSIFKKSKEGKEGDENSSSCEREVAIRIHSTYRSIAYRRRTPRPAMD